MTFGHLADRSIRRPKAQPRQSRGFRRSAVAASGGGRLVPQSADSGPFHTDDGYRRAGVSCCKRPLPNGCDRELEPSERVVIEPEPNGRVWPVTVRPSRPVSVLSAPEPKGRVCVVVPSDQRVIVPEPNFCVWPVTVRPSRVRSVVMEPDPKGRVWLVEPSERFVIEPEPNGRAWPERGCTRPARGGVGSAAVTARPEPASAAHATAVQTTRLDRSTLRDAMVKNPPLVEGRVWDIEFIESDPPAPPEKYSPPIRTVASLMRGSGAAPRPP
jgi:hypothetical protein